MPSLETVETVETVETAQTAQTDHKERHVELHECLDELVADWISQTEGLPSQTSLMKFMAWSHEQTITPSKDNSQTERKSK